MTDQELLQRAELVYEKLLAIRADLYDPAQEKGEGSPEHTAWRNACVYMRAQGEVVAELKRRAGEPAANEKLLRDAEAVQSALHTVQGHLLHARSTYGEGSPEHEAYKHVCAYGRVQGEIVAELKGRAAEPAVPALA